MQDKPTVSRSSRRVGPCSIPFQTWSGSFCSENTTATKIPDMFCLVTGANHGEDHGTRKGDRKEKPCRGFALWPASHGCSMNTPPPQGEICKLIGTKSSEGPGVKASLSSRRYLHLSLCFKGGKLYRREKTFMNKVEDVAPLLV